MDIVAQKGDILVSPPFAINDLDYVVVYTGNHNICMILQNIDDRTVLSITAEDHRFEEVIKMLGIEKNKSPVRELDI